MSIKENAIWAILGLPFSLLSAFYYIYSSYHKEKTNLNGKIVFITGASSGLGAACAKVFYKMGCKVILSGRNLEKLNLVKSQLETDMFTEKMCESHPPVVVVMDLHDIDNIRPTLETVTSTYGAVDILVNNAGLSYRGEAVTTTLEVNRLLIEVNYLAQVEVTQALLPKMISQGSGHIVAIGSVQGRIAIPHRTAYTASKHAMQAYFDSLRSEVKTHGVNVSVVNPYYIATNLSLNAVTGDGSAYGKTDATTKAGLAPDYVASKVVSCVINKTPEMTVAPFHVQLAIALRSMSPWLFFKIMEHRARKEQKQKQE